MRHLGMIFFLSCALFTLHLQSSSTANPELDVVKGLELSKGSAMRPENWQNLHDDSICDNGTQQSPINVDESNAVYDWTLWFLRTDYHPSAAYMQNRDGHEIRVSWPDGGGSLQIGGKSYVLLQCHWHTPSEHTVNGKRYPLEQHLVHQSSDGKIAVIGILFSIGEKDPFLTEKLMWSLKQVENPGDRAYLGPVQPPEIPIISSYYRYLGSLTTPPCTEGVVWTLVKRARTVSRKQFGLLRAALNWHENARPIQPLNGRTVSLFETWSAQDASS